MTSHFLFSPITTQAMWFHSLGIAGARSAWKNRARRQNIVGRLCATPCYVSIRAIFRPEAIRKVNANLLCRPPPLFSDLNRG